MNYDVRENERRRMLANSKKKTERAIRILIYVIIAILVTPIIFSIFAPFIAKKIFEDINKSFVKEFRYIRPDVEKIVSPKKEIKIEKEPGMKLAKPQKFKGTIYSWTDKEGKRIFSNVGFPKNETYTDAKIDLNE